MATLREKYIAGLEMLCFYRDDNHRSSKYIKMVHADDPTRIYWVGTHGGLRVGRISSDSFGVMDINKKKIANIGMVALNKKANR